MDSQRRIFLQRAARIGGLPPDLDAGLFFNPNEIRGAHLLNRKKMSASPTTLNEILRLIAQVDDFLGRKSDGEPGVKNILRGLSQPGLCRSRTLRALRDGLG